ncbi:hypothetical protein AB1E18_006533 [Capra hircus]
MASENLPQGSTRHRLSQPSSSRIFPMAFVLSLLMALVLVSYAPGGSLGCDLSQNHVLVGRKNLMLLGQMRRLSPRFCLQDRKDFAFPQEMVEGGQLQEAQAVSVLHEMLQQSFNLFHTEGSSAAWDTTLLEQLRTGLHQQLDDLDACLGQVMGEEDSALGRMGPTLAVKRYFQGIHVYLKEKEYSDCAWETVRVEIMRSLSSSVSLQERSYSLLRFQQERSLEVCQNLLWQLPSTPQHCLEFRMDFQMPEEMKQAQQFRKEDAILVMYEMLQQIFNILTRDFSSTGWSDAIIEHLLEELYGQMNRLEPIQKEIMQKQTSTMGDTTDLHLRKYYFNLGQYLKSKEHNRRRLSQPSSSRIFPMAFVLFLLMALVLVSYGPGGSLGCDLSQNHVLFGRKNLRLLGEMRRISPRFCLQDRKDFDFPQEMVEGGQLQEAQAISVLHEMLQQSFNLFHTERSSAAWDTTLLEQLRTGLHQQLDHLDACLGQVMGEEDSALGRTGPTLAVKRYFQGIHVYLQEKGYSDCAWETVRVEIMRSLSSSASL